MPICPHCGGARVDRYCGACGRVAAQVSAPTLQQALIIPTAQRRKAVRTLALLGLSLFGFMAFTIFSARQVSVSPDAVPARFLPALPAHVQVFDALETQIAARVSMGRATVASLNARTSLLQNDVERFTAERNDVYQFRQRLSQARLQAENEGRWPTKAAGRSFDRIELKDAVDRTDQWLKKCDSACKATESRLTQCGIVIGQAERILLAMQRIDEDLKSRPPSEQTTGDYGIRQEAQGKFRGLSTQLDEVMNDPALRAPRLSLPPFDITMPDNR